jgi:UDP-glucose 4-epimerase
VIRGSLSAGARRFVYVTTGGALYGRPVQLPCREDHPIEPLSPYGWTKFLVERYLDMLVRERMSWVALRLANVYGPRQRADGEAGVVARFTDQMAGRRPVVIDGDGEQTRDFVYVGDVVDAVTAAIDSPVGGPLNIGTGAGTSVNKLFAVLASITGYPFEPLYGPARDGDVRDSVLASTRARTELGWEPRVPLEDGLRRTCTALHA